MLIFLFSKAYEVPRIPDEIIIMDWLYALSPVEDWKMQVYMSIVMLLIRLNMTISYDKSGLLQISLMDISLELR